MRRTITVFLFALLLCAATVLRAAGTNSLSWHADTDMVSADVRNEPLLHLLEDIAHQTGWHVFVEPNALQYKASVKFRDLPSGEALHKLLGSVNFAFVPRTNGPQELYVFSTTQRAATQAVGTVKAKPGPQKHIANELLVKVKPGGNIESIAKALGAKIIARNDKLGLYRLQFDNSAATDAALGSLKSNPDVATVDYNYVYDPPVNAQPLANAPANSGQVSLTLSQSTPGDPCNPVIGLIDTGLQSLGSQLDQLVTKKIDITGDSSSLSTTEPTHATSMANAIFSAVSQQSPSTSVRLISVNVYGNSENTTSWNVALGVQAAVDNGATVLNMSLGGNTDSAVLRDIIQQALAKGIVVFAAAGNEPVDTPTYPAAISGVNAITALGSPGQLAAYANRGSFVEMALPGTAMVNYGNQTWVVQGTSPATAYATGVAAGAKAVNCQSWSQIESAMQNKFPVPQK